MIICFDFGHTRLRAKLRQSATADAVAAALPLDTTVSTWGDEVYFQVPVTAEPEADAREVVEPGEIAFWCDGHCIAIGFGPTPLSRDDEIRLAAPVNIFADAMDDVRTLRNVEAGSRVRVQVSDQQ